MFYIHVEYWFYKNIFLLLLKELQVFSFINEDMFLN